MVDFWCRFFHGLVPIFSRFGADFSRFIRDINGEKKTSRYWWCFSRLVFHGLPPLDFGVLRGDKRQSAVFGGLLRFAAVFCENLRFPNASFSRKRRESAKISENLGLGSVCPLRFIPLSAPWIWETLISYHRTGTEARLRIFLPKTFCPSHPFPVYWGIFRGSFSPMAQNTNPELASTEGTIGSPWTFVFVARIRFRILETGTNFVTDSVPKSPRNFQPFFKSTPPCWARKTEKKIG